MIKPSALVSTLVALSSALGGCSDKTSSSPGPSASLAVTTTARASSTTEPSSRSAPAPSASSRGAEALIWSFDEQDQGKPPVGLEIFTAEGKPSAWLVEGHQFGHSAPQVLYVGKADAHDARYTGVVGGPALKDARVSVYCRMEAIRHDTPDSIPNPGGFCGVVARFKDAKSYYLAAANAHDGQVSLYVVKDGRRTSIGAWKGEVKPDAWLELALEVKGDSLAVSWDGKRVHEAHDKTFTDAGRAGLWTLVSSLTEFDDLSVTPL